MDAPSNALEGVRSLVTEHDLHGGDRLPPERDIAAALGISRAPLREALRRLVDLGVLEPRVGAGTFLVPIDLPALMQVRLALEPLAASLAAERVDDRLRGRLRGLLDRLRDAVDDAHAFAALDAALHRTLADASGNPVLQTCLRDIEVMALFGRSRTARAPHTRTRTLTELERIVGAVAAADGPGAADAMADHLRSIAAQLPPAPSCHRGAGHRHPRTARSA